VTTSQYQLQLFEKLQHKFVDVRNEWNAFERSVINQYSPRVDIAIGPFNDHAAKVNLERTYDEMVKEYTYSNFIKRAFDFHTENLSREKYETIIPYSFYEAIERNKNARCLIAIEIENKNSRKHIMGSIVNAASLGRIGIGVGFTKESKNSFLRIVNYLGFLKEVGKNSYETANFFVLSTDQMNELVKKE
jgi:hypothetical protein